MAIQPIPPPPIVATDGNDTTPLMHTRLPSYAADQDAESQQVEKHSNRALARRSPSTCFSYVAKKFMEPYLDSKGSLSSVCTGCLYMLLIGIALGLIVPSNSNLPTPWYRIMSNILGYTYFTFWCVSLYPQLILNFQRKSTVGLSNDYTVINLVGYSAYTAYTCAFYWSKSVQIMYEEREDELNHDDSILLDTDLVDSGAPKVTIQSNDVAFAIHSLIITIIWTWQTFAYGGFDRDRLNGRWPISPAMMMTCILITLSCFIYPYLIILVDSDQIDTSWIPNIVLSELNWIDYLYYLSYIKVFITAIKYPFQILENVHHQSTEGWNIWNTIFDFTGGLFSLVQLIGDAIDVDDLPSILGSAGAKFWLGLVSCVFCLVFFIQHYILYRDNTQDRRKNDSDTLSLQESNSETLSLQV